MEKMTSTTHNVDLSDAGFSPKCRDLIEGLLKHDVPDRLGCHGKGFVLLKEFIIDKQQRVLKDG